MTPDAKLKEAQFREDLGQVPSYKEAGLTPKFASLVMRRQECDAQIKELEEKKRGFSDEVFELLAHTGLKAVMVDTYRPQIVDTPGRRTLSPERLLELGVPASTIEAAMVTGKPSTYLRVDDTAARHTRTQEKRAGVAPIKGKGRK